MTAFSSSPQQVVVSSLTPLFYYFEYSFLQKVKNVNVLKKRRVTKYSPFLHELASSLEVVIFHVVKISL